ncbi:MAG: hypothetical protein WC464_02435 [Bdellovibrionales bacterium]
MPEPIPTVPRPNIDLSASFDEMLQNLDAQFEQLSMRALGQFNFVYDGFDFNVRHVEHEGRYCFLINATLGFMPFTIESSERREAIRSIIVGSWDLPKVRFGMDVSGRIMAKGLYEAPAIVAPDFIFYPLTLFLQEARPFVNLIGKYLSQSTSAHVQNKEELLKIEDD